MTSPAAAGPPIDDLNLPVQVEETRDVPKRVTPRRAGTGCEHHADVDDADTQDAGEQHTGRLIVQRPLPGIKTGLWDSRPAATRTATG